MIDKLILTLVLTFIFGSVLSIITTVKAPGFESRITIERR